MDRTKRKRGNDIFPAPAVILLASIITGAPLAARIAVRHSTINLKQKIASLENERMALLSAVSELELQRAALSRPERIREVARRKLGLKEAGEDRVVIIPIMEDIERE